MAEPAPVRRGSARGRGAPKPRGQEISYSGRIFASGLEARWAILLDLLGVNWDFEPSHYQLSSKLWYLPDFYLPELQIWLEVKGLPFFTNSDALKKAVYAVAGPEPIPQREHPYGPSQMILFGGSLRAPSPDATPVHTMVLNAGDGKAVTRMVCFQPTEQGLILAPLTPVIHRFDAATITRSSASSQLGEQLLAPEPMAVASPPWVVEAYRVAAKVKFTSEGRVDATGIHDTAMILQRRRAGRPLPKTSWPKNLNRF